MNYEIELIQDEKAVVGEGPVWDPHTEKLYWTDIRTGRLFEYVPGHRGTPHHSRRHIRRRSGGQQAGRPHTWDVGRCDVVAL